MHTLVRSPLPCPAFTRACFWNRLLPALFAVLLTVRARAAAEAVVRYSGDDIVDAATINYNAVNLGSFSTRSFTFHNIGPDVMTGISFSSNGAHADDFTVSAPATSVLLPGGIINFSITFAPSQAFIRTAAVHIANSDPNENPYDLNLRGTGVAPEITVTAGSGNATDGGSLNFGSVRVGLTGTRQVRISNAGNATLSNLSVSLTGQDFSATALGGTPGVTSLAPGAAATIIVSFTPQGTFPSNGQLRISSNDADENPFDLTLTGSGVLPLLDVESPPGAPTFDGADTLTLTAPAGVSVQRTFLLRNVSASDITGIAVSLDGPGAVDFTTSPLPATTLAPAETLTFTLTFTAPAPGDSNAALHIAMDQSPANPFDIALTGTGVVLSDTGDEDSDGVMNLLETATGGDPLSPGPQPGVLVMIADSTTF